MNRFCPLSGSAQQAEPEIREARWPRDVDLVRKLFREYADSLDVDLSFQDFEAELANLPRGYAFPRGRVLLAFAEETVVGCVAFRSLAVTSCELKRLYVRPQARGMKAGRQLVLRACLEARLAGYLRIYLDTLPGMVAAQRLYQSLGFQDTDAYVFNPIAGSRYLYLDLGSWSSQTPRS